MALVNDVGHRTLAGERDDHQRACAYPGNHAQDIVFRPFQPDRMTAAACPAGDIAPDEKRLAAKAAQIYRGRRVRDRVFEDLNLFAEPAWDIMLDLFVAAAEGRTISVSSAAIASSVALSTGLRWIDTLLTCGLIERLADPTDRRRTFVRLTERGHILVMRAVEASDGTA